MKTSQSGSGCGARQHTSCQHVPNMHEHFKHLMSGQTYRHRQLWAFENFGWVCFISSSSPPLSHYSFKNTRWNIAPEKHNLHVIELNIGLEETITLSCDNWCHSALSPYPYILRMTPYSHYGIQVQIRWTEIKLWGLTLMLMALIPARKLELDIVALALNPVFTVKVV